MAKRNSIYKLCLLQLLLFSLSVGVCVYHTVVLMSNHMDFSLIAHIVNFPNVWKCSWRVRLCRFLFHIKVAAVAHNNIYYESRVLHLLLETLNYSRCWWISFSILCEKHNFNLAYRQERYISTIYTWVEQKMCLFCISYILFKYVGIQIKDNKQVTN